MGVPSGDTSTTDVNQITTPSHVHTSANASPASAGTHHDAAAARPVSRSRYSYAPGYSNGDNYSPTSRTAHAAPASDAHYRPNN
ncbi:hypothetical protein H4S02_013210, partial [Coemansia sp. RSA 2611]